MTETLDLTAAIFSKTPAGQQEIQSRALGLAPQRWLDVDTDETPLYVDSRQLPATTPAGSTATKASAAPR